MDNYISNLCIKWNHPDPKKRHIFTYKHTPIVYAVKFQFATEPPFILPLDAQGIFHVQSIFGALLYYAQDVNNKLLVGINEIFQKQASVTKDTNDALLQLLDYVATYPNYGILY